MPQTTATLETASNYNKRLALIQSRLFELFTPIRDKSKATALDIFEAVGESLITDSTTTLMPVDVRKVETRLSALLKSILPDYLAKDRFLQHTDSNEYNVQWYEHSYELSTLANRNVFLGNPSKAARERALENQINILWNSEQLRARRRLDAINVTNIIRTGVSQSQGLRTITRNIDVALGFRDPQGKLTELAIRKMQAGELVKRNGQIYESVRIARTELSRIHGVSTRDAMLRAQSRGWDERLQKISVLDSRTRPQSRQMHMQVSNEEGQFQYPDGNFYAPGTQPIQWLANDRGAFVPWIPDIPDREERTFIFQENYRDANGTLQTRDVPVISGPFASFNEWTTENGIRVRQVV